MAAATDFVLRAGVPTDADAITDVQVASSPASTPALPAHGRNERAIPPLASSGPRRTG